jgi:CHAD domain-containing protein
MRVSTRRLKSTLAAYRSAFDPATGRHLRGELDWLAQTLGHGRDYDVQRDLLRGLVSGADEVAQVEAASRTMAAEARLTLSTALSSARYRVLAEELDSFSASPPWTCAANQPARKLLAASVTREFHRVEVRVAAAETKAPTTVIDDRLHRVRKSVKRARYATEAAAPVLGQKASDLARRLSSAQDVLGTHNDVVVTRASRKAWADLGVTALGREVRSQLDAKARGSRRAARHELKSLGTILATPGSGLTARG